ncbi:MAG: 30S ribosomal protein S17 [Rhodospirillales bacterium]|nr:MAG: 30S ribosomal protein S17 [Rhodospirillales bacterium]
MPRRVMQGVVVSDAMDKTIVVKVERRVMHPIYKKFVRQSKKYLAHDEANAAKAGDIVRIRECRPLSRRKCWELVGAAEDEGAEGRIDAASGAGATDGATGQEGRPA